MCLAEGHKAVTPVRPQPAAPWSRVQHSTTEPLRSLIHLCIKGKGEHNLMLNVNRLYYR